MKLQWTKCKKLFHLVLYVWGLLCSLSEKGSFNHGKLQKMLSGHHIKAPPWPRSRCMSRWHWNYVPTQQIIIYCFADLSNSHTACLQSLHQLTTVVARLCIEVFRIKVKVQTSWVIQFHLSCFVYARGTTRTIPDGPVTLKVEMRKWEIRKYKGNGTKAHYISLSKLLKFLSNEKLNVSIQILPRKHQRGICKGSWHASTSLLAAF